MEYRICSMERSKKIPYFSSPEARLGRYRWKREDTPWEAMALVELLRVDEGTKEQVSSSQSRQRTV